jgi:uncharacterized membrane protein YphA (DoxX/SURF4 family)
VSVTVASRSGGALAIVALRLALGLLFLTVWGSNLNKGLYNPGPYSALIDFYADTGDAPGLWKDVMRFVADQATVASKLQLVTELLFGILLVLGLATRPVGVASGLFLSSLWLSEIGVPNEWIWSLVFPSLVAFTLAIVSGGRVLGLDAFMLDRPPLARLPRWARG